MRHEYLKIILYTVNQLSVEFLLNIYCGLKIIYIRVHTGRYVGTYMKYMTTGNIIFLRETFSKVLHICDKYF